MRYFLEIVCTFYLLTYVVGQHPGEFCTLRETGRPGKCLHLSMCPVAVKAAMRSISPQICGYRGTVSIVCCPQAIVEGSNCTMKDTGMAGACTQFANCRTAIAAASNGILPQICAAGENLVCCSDACPPLSKELVSQQRSGSKAADYCIDLSEEIFPCEQTGLGWRRGDLCPPMPNPEEEYSLTPLNTTTEAHHYGRLGNGLIANINWNNFGVTPLSHRWLVSSAWAVESYGSKGVQFVGLGGRFRPTYIPDAIYGVIRTIIHPEYNSTYSIAYNDLALLQTDRPIIFTSHVLPACLHTGSPLPAGALIHTGWDYYSSTETKTTMKTVTRDECSTSYIGNERLPDGVKDSLQFCSRTTKEERPGWWHGSPLYIHNGPKVACTSLLVGVLTAYSNSQPSTLLFTRVAAYVPWIESVVWP